MTSRDGKKEKYWKEHTENEICSKANKTNGGRKIVKAYCLGENSEMERQLIQEGAIRKHADGHYELFSLEAKDGQGQTAQPGDYFKVDTLDGKHYPYPNDRKFFRKIICI